MNNQLFSDRWHTDEGRRVTQAVVQGLRTDVWDEEVFAFTGTPRDSHRLQLKGIDLCGHDLHGLDLSQLILSYANFAQASLVGADLQGCDLDGADFTDADLRDAQLAGCTARGASFRNADLTGSFAMSADFTAADFSRANLSQAAMSATIAVRAEFDQAIFDRTDLDVANWRDARLNVARWKDMHPVNAVVPHEAVAWAPSTVEVPHADGPSPSGEELSAVAASEAFLQVQDFSKIQSALTRKNVLKALKLRKIAGTTARKRKDEELYQRVARALLDYGVVEKHGVLKTNFRLMRRFGEASHVPAEVSTSILLKAYTMGQEPDVPRAGPARKAK